MHLEDLLGGRLTLGQGERFPVRDVRFDGLDVGFFVGSREIPDTDCFTSKELRSEHSVGTIDHGCRAALNQDRRAVVQPAARDLACSTSSPANRTRMPDLSVAISTSAVPSAT